MWSWFSPAVPIVQAWLVILTSITHFLTAFSDPGIIPRDMVDEEEEGSNPWGRGRAVSRKPQKYMINGVAVQTKFCRTCQLHRPPRAVHCGVCDNCVDRFDHHCPWTGNCVGRRNYRIFLLYVLLVPCVCCFTCGTLVAKIIVLSLNSPNTGPQAFWEAVTIDIAAPILAVYSLIPLGLVGFLLVYHMMLSVQGLTTNERLKHTYDATGNPYSRGWFRNVLERWCGYYMTRYVKFHVVRMEQKNDPPLPKDWRVLRPNEVEMLSLTLNNNNNNNDNHNNNDDDHDINIPKCEKEIIML